MPPSQRSKPYLGRQVTIDRRHFLSLAGASLATVQLAACGTEKLPTDGVPRSSFDETSTADEVMAGIDLAGKYAVVTGCTSGIGLETMRVLASRGAHVIGSSRSLSRAAAACAKTPGVTTPVALDLGDFDSVVSCAEKIRSMNVPIDMLICNAGYLGGGNVRQLINDLEKHFVINHLGHFVFVNRLLDRLVIAEQGRIVIVASRMAYTDAPTEGILFDDLDFSEDYKDFRAYGHSKLANVLFSLRLSELLRGTRITCNSLHPGIIDTEIDRHFNSFMQFGMKMVASIGGKTINEGAATTCYVATNPVLAETTGAYFEDCNAVTVQGHNHLYNTSMAEKLMQISAAITAPYLVEQKSPTRENLLDKRSG